MDEKNTLSPQAQQLLIQLQTLQQQVQAIAIQKEGLSMQKMEIEMAQKELEKSKDADEVFKAIGPVLIKTSKKDMAKELSEKTETIELRLSTLAKQDEKLKEKAKETQNSLQAALKPSSKSAG